MTIKIKSAVTFFRKQLGFRGKSQHWGRGYYNCFVKDEGITQQQVFDACVVLANKLEQNGHATITIAPDSVEIVLDKSVTDLECYKTLWIYRKTNWGGVNWQISM